MSNHEHDYHIHKSYDYQREYDFDDQFIFGAIWLCPCGVWKVVKYYQETEEIV